MVDSGPDTGAAAEYAYLQTPRAIRERAALVFAAARHQQLAHFRLDETRLSEVVERVLAVTRRAYPNVATIPYHGRYRHFDAGGVPRLQRFLEAIQGLSPDDRLRTSTELVITSVLLDAGAGPDWCYREPDGTRFARSEGLAVASYHLFLGGGFSSAAAPMADAAGLSRFDSARLAQAFQVSSANPLTGLEGRADLLARLGQVVASTPEYFSPQAPRLGDLGVYLKHSARDGKLAASRVLAAVLAALGEIWPGREQLAGKPLGDVWRHGSFGLVPFHKLSQWLSYSLLEPLEAAGVTVTALDELTGLPEYRNGGLFLDAGALALVDQRAREAEHAVSSELVIEWRALTVALLDRVAELVREKLGLNAEQLPLARVLEGGTWSAGRAVAAELRPGGGPPLKIVSDGTVF
ncbi:MAG TPA: URC4/urg3 family protein [Polyangiaceae bacterium]|nr:URC4/urg3 family protein [Polyangiaceae bacterium]